MTEKEVEFRENGEYAYATLNKELLELVGAYDMFRIGNKRTEPKFSAEEAFARRKEALFKDTLPYMINHLIRYSCDSNEHYRALRRKAKAHSRTIGRATND